MCVEPFHLGKFFNIVNLAHERIFGVLNGAAPAHEIIGGKSVEELRGSRCREHMAGACGEISRRFRSPLSEENRARREAQRLKEEELLRRSIREYKEAQATVAKTVNTLRGVEKAEKIQ